MSTNLVEKIVSVKELMQLLADGKSVFMNLANHDPEAQGDNTPESEFFYCSSVKASERQNEVWANGGIFTLSPSGIENEVDKRFVSEISYPGVIEVSSIVKLHYSKQGHSLLLDDGENEYLANGYIPLLEHHVNEQMDLPLEEAN